MKIRLLIIFFILGVARVSFSQVLVGPTVGLNYSRINFSDRDNLDTFKVKPVFGFHAGALLSMRVQKRFFLNTGLVYSTKGKIIEGKFDKELRNKVRYHYIEMPITYTVEFKSTLKNNKVFKWYLGMGPNVAYWLGGKGTLQNSDLTEVEIPSQSYKVVFNKENPGVHEMNVNDPNRVQLALNFSAGVAFEPASGYKKFLLTVRYEWGHSNLSRTSRSTFANTVSYQDEMRAHISGFRLSVAYLIDLRTEERKRGKSTSTIGKKKR